jgi:hypothetical protein
MHNYQNGAVFHQLTDVGVRGGVGGDNESVDVWTEGVHSTLYMHATVY